MTIDEKMTELKESGVKRIMTGIDAFLEQKIHDLEMEVANLKADIDALMGCRRVRTELDEQYAKAVWASIKEREDM